MSSTLSWIFLAAVFVLIGWNIWKFNKLIQSVEAAHTRKAEAIEIHQKCVNSFLLSFVPPVVCIEILVILEKWRGGSLFYFHMVLVVLFCLSSALMRYKYNGYNYPTPHRQIKYVMFGSYVLVVFTGILLILRRLM